MRSKVRTHFVRDPLAVLPSLVGNIRLIMEGSSRSAVNRSRISFIVSAPGAVRALRSVWAMSFICNRCVKSADDVRSYSASPPPPASVVKGVITH